MVADRFLRTFLSSIYGLDPKYVIIVKLVIMSEEAFFTRVWIASLISMLIIMGYRISLGDYAGFREISMAASAWCSISAIGLMVLRWTGLEIFED